MANAPKQSAPAQRPAPKPAQDFDLFRPFRMIHHFVTNTTRDVLNCMAKWGARGFTIGGIAGVVLGLSMAASPIGMGLLGIIYGTGAGFAVGAVLGVVTGGPSNAMRAGARENRGRRFDSEARGEHIDRVNDSNVERILQQNQEFERNESYWQDRVSQGHGGFGRGL